MRDTIEHDCKLYVKSISDFGTKISDNMVFTCMQKASRYIVSEEYKEHRVRY
jgi:hypothetical protein